MTPLVALPTSAERTEAGDAVRWLCKYSATTPATCGDAIDVPVAVAVIKLPLPIHAEGMLTPGANRSTVDP